MGDVVIRFAGRRRRILDHLEIARSHAGQPLWWHDPVRRDAVAFRLVLAARLARDVERPADLAEPDWLWLREGARFGSVHEPAPDEFRRVVESELPPVAARLRASIEA